MDQSPKVGVPIPARQGNLGGSAWQRQDLVCRSDKDVA